MPINNRAAESGSEIISNTNLRTFTRRVIGLKILADTVIETITSPTQEPTTGISWFQGKTLYAGDTIEANIATLKLTSGAVQAFYQA